MATKRMLKSEATTDEADPMGGNAVIWVGGEAVVGTGRVGGEAVVSTGRVGGEAVVGTGRVGGEAVVGTGRVGGEAVVSTDPVGTRSPSFRTRILQPRFKCVAHCNNISRGKANNTAI